MNRSLVIGLAFAGLVVASYPAAAQERSQPRWERPGFDISPNGGWRVKARRVAAERRRLVARRDFRALNAPMLAGPATTAQVTGIMQVPLVLFHYLDTPLGNVRPIADYDQLLFGTTPPSGRPYTLRTYYEDMSNGDFSMQGEATGWAALDSNEVTYTGQTGTCFGNGMYCNGLFSSDAIWRMHSGLREALVKSDTGATGIDFARFDNDGPDNMPNSGDDDGFVDMMGFAHATQDGACRGNNHIWAHRYALLNSNQSDYLHYVTDDARFGGGPIRVRDYFIQSGLGGAGACDPSQIMPIGTAAHEFGHALGLPDLYDTQGPTEGIGSWGLMGSGSYSSPNSPARMEAWSLNELGWVTVVPITTSGTHSFGPAPTADTAFLVTPLGNNPRGEYFLLENRQDVSADTGLIQDACEVWYQSSTPPPCAGGLLIWHVDSQQVTNSGFSTFNSVNVGSVHGVELEEADGARDLWCPGPIPSGCNRGDAGDLYPGITGNRRFGGATNPNNHKDDGSSSGFRIDSITQVSPDGPMRFDIRFGGEMVIRAADAGIPVTVDGIVYTPRYVEVLGVTDTVDVSVADTSTTNGGRTRHVWQSWSDGGARQHLVMGTNGNDSTITAQFSRTHLLTASAGGGGTVAPSPVVNLGGEFLTEGASIDLTATPGTGSVFARWTGDTSATTPTLTLLMSRPFTVTAVFAPNPATDAVAAHLLGPTQPLTADQLVYLDHLGNQNGSFDVGDFLAWVKATGAPAPADVWAALAVPSGRVQ